MHHADLTADVAEILVSEAQIQAKVAELGARLSADYAGRELTLVSVLKGSLPFMADLMRAISIPVDDRPHGGQLVRRHGDRVVRPGAHPQGPLVVHRRPGRAHRRGHHRHRPDAQLPDPLPARQGTRARLRICTLLDKPARRLVEIDIDYRGFEIPDQFVVGYGLDYGELYRNLPYIGVLRPEVYGGT